MAMEQRLIPQMTQQLRMTPQLQQAIKLLQLSRMELISVVQQEMVENPVLEEAQESYESESLHDRELGIDEPAPKQDSDQTAEVQANERDVDNVDWESFAEHFATPMPENSYRGMGDELPGVDQTLSTSISLTEHLMEQLHMSGLSDEEMYVGTLLIGNLDEDGYLRHISLDEIALDAEVTLEVVEDILDVLQTFDPVGVAARSLEECLLIQLAREHDDSHLAQAMVRDHIHNLERKSYAKIARDLDASTDEVIDAARLISTLEPKPGRPFMSEEGNSYITPDIYVRQHNNDWIVSLNEDGLPKLRISSYYRQELQRKRAHGERDEVKDYIQGKLRNAMWLINSIHQRQSTIVKVMESILVFQRDFFDHGIEHLKPLVLRDVADDIGMHESTVSRVTTNKWVHTPRGIFELKFFFNSSITKHGGEDLASEAVKAKIREIISGEDTKKPLSDARIVEILAEEDIDIARRTVAKYREMMGILSSAKRKCVF